MSDEPYTKREMDMFMEKVDESFQKIEKRFDDIQNENMRAHAKFDEKQTYANSKIASILKWQERAMGAAWAIGLIGSLIVLPLLTWAFITVSKIDDNIKKGIDAALAEYDINK